MLTFPNYYVFSFGSNRADIQNIVLVGVNGDLPLTEEALIKKLHTVNQNTLAGKIVKKASIVDSESVILTNNFSPVEHLMSPVIHEYFSNNVLLVKKLLLQENNR